MDPQDGMYQAAQEWGDKLIKILGIKVEELPEDPVKRLEIVRTNLENDTKKRVGLIIPEIKYDGFPVYKEVRSIAYLLGIDEVIEGKYPEYFIGHEDEMSLTDDSGKNDIRLKNLVDTVRVYAQDRALTKEVNERQNKKW